MTEILNSQIALTELTSLTSVTLSSFNANVEGSSIYVFCGYASTNSSDPIITDTAGNIYTIVSKNLSADNNIMQIWAYKDNITTGIINITAEFPENVNGTTIICAISLLPVQIPSYSGDKTSGSIRPFTSKNIIKDYVTNSGGGRLVLTNFSGITGQILEYTTETMEVINSASITELGNLRIDGLGATRSSDSIIESLARYSPTLEGGGYYIISVGVYDNVSSESKSKSNVDITKVQLAGIIIGTFLAALFLSFVVVSFYV